MHLQLSSRLTFFFKFIFPLFFILTVGYAFVYSFALDQTIKWFFLFIWLIGILFSLRFCIPLKQVEICDKSFIITNYFKKISVSMVDVERVDEMAFSIHPVFVIFKKKTEFGKQIVFMPKKKISFGGSHSTVNLLQEMISNKK